MSVGLKETLEVLSAADVVCAALLKACEDGKLGLLDLRYALEPAKAAVAAVRGREFVIGELKDLDSAELEVLVTRSVALGTKLVEAVEALGKAMGA